MSAVQDVVARDVSQIYSLCRWSPMLTTISSSSNTRMTDHCSHKRVLPDLVLDRLANQEIGSLTVSTTPQLAGRPHTGPAICFQIVLLPEEQRPVLLDLLLSTFELTCPKRSRTLKTRLTQEATARTVVRLIFTYCTITLQVGCQYSRTLQQDKELGRCKCKREY